MLTPLKHVFPGLLLTALSFPLFAQAEIYSIEGPASGIEFGRNAIGVGDQNGDGFADILIGANRDQTAGSWAGSARIYSGADGSLIHEFFGENKDDHFGSSMGSLGDLNGDGFNDFGVSANGDDDNGDNCGSVRVIAGSTFQTLFTLFGPTARDRFGSTIASLGDLTGDGFPEFVVGSRNSSATASYAGAAQVHSADGSLLFRLEGMNAGDLFGKRVSSADDMTGDGIPDFLVAANRFDGAAGANTGAVFLYSGADASLVLQVEGENAEDRFGGNIVGGHDLDGDGSPDFLVHAAADGPSGLKAGSVTAFSSGGTKLFSLYGESPGDLFGSGLCFAGDLDGDGVEDFAVGSPQSDLTGVDNGNLRFFSGASQEALYSHDGFALGGELGTNLALVGDIDGDGVSEFISGAPLADSAQGADAGRVIVFSMGDHGPALWTQSLVAGNSASMILQNASPQSQIVFGWSFVGGGPLSTPWGSVSLSLPVKQKKVMTDAFGVAVIGASVPSVLRGTAIWFQALDLASGTLSNGLAQVVQ